MKPQLHLSLHDVAPPHLERLKRAEQLLCDLGVSRITYLMVPDFHASGASERNDAFLRFCRGERPFEVEWALHGFHHRETAPEQAGSFRERFARRWMTGGEGEFLALTQPEAELLLRRGVESFRTVFGTAPRHFVPPAWLWHPELPQALAAVEIESFEAHRGIARVDGGEAHWLDAPVITWATRTWLRRKGSLVVCPALSARWSDKPLVRIAMHPNDFDWSQTVKSIRAVIQKELRRRSETTVEKLLSGVDD